MTGKTHIMGGVASCTIAASFVDTDPAFMVTAGAVGGILPDICHSGSTIGRKMPIVSRIINLLFGHRTFTHSLLFMLIAGGLLFAFSPYTAINYGLLIGMASHLVLDAFTNSGIGLLYPLKTKITFPVTTKTGGLVEHVVLAIMAVGTFYFGQDIITSYFL